VPSSAPSSTYTSANGSSQAPTAYGMAWPATSARMYHTHYLKLVYSLTCACRLCEILLGITSACLPSAAYGFRHKDSVYHRILHPSQYFGSRQYASKQYNSRQYHSSISKPVTPQGFAIADAEELIPRASRTQIRCETSVEVSSSECDAEEKMEAREEQPWEEAKDVELAVLEPAHLAAPHKLQRRVSVNDVEVQRVMSRR
jgi:hypothetical protein